MNTHSRPWKRRGSATAAVLVAGSLVLSGCGRGDSAENGGDLAGPGFDGKTFTVAALTATSGPGAPLASANLTGLQTYLEKLNAEGGIDGKYPVELTVRDTAMDPAKTVQQYNSVKEDVAMVGQVFATPPTKALLPLLKKDKTLAVIAGQAGELFEEEQIVMTTSPYESSYLSAVGYAADTWGADQTVCAAAGEGATTDTMKGVLAYAKKEMGTKVGPVVSLPAGAGDYTPQMQQLKRAQCDTVLYLALAIPVMTTAFESSAQVDFAPHWLGGGSGFLQAMKESPIMPYIEKNVQIVCDCTDYGDTENAPAMKDLKAAHDKYSSDTAPAWNYRNGYVSGMVIEQILRKAVKDGDLSREGIMKANESLTEVDLGGIQFPIAWGAPQDRKPATKYSVFVPDSSTELGLRMTEYGKDAVPASVDFPYETE